MARLMAAMWTGGCEPPYELLVRRLCQEYNYNPPMLRAQPLSQIARELAVLEAEARVTRAARR